MKANKFCIFRLLASLLAVAIAGGAGRRPCRLLAQQIEMIGARQWLGLMAGAIVANDAGAGAGEPADRRPLWPPVHQPGC